MRRTSCIAVGVIAAAACGLAGAVAAEADTIFFDGFETPTVPGDVAGQTPAVGLSWTDGGAPTSTFQVVHASAAHTGAGYLDVFRASGDASTLSAHFTKQTTDRVVVEYRFRLQSTGPTVALESFLADDEERIGGVLVHNNGVVQLTDHHGAGTNLGFSLIVGSGSWHHARLEYVPGFGTIFLSVDGNPAVSTATGFAGNPDRLNFRDTQVGTWYLLDDVQVMTEAVPEPASSALVGLGALTLARRAGRHHHTPTRTVRRPL